VRNESLLLGTLAVGAVFALGVSVPLARGDAGLSARRTIDVSEIHEGMKGYGLTVFKGTEPERFDVEVICVIRRFMPGQDLILIKTPHPRLDIAKTVAGMSGSPIFLDGRLAGAYAYSLASFAVEPIAGVTPIAPMLAEMARPTPPGFWGSPSPTAAASPAAPHASLDRDSAPFGTTAFAGAPGEYDGRVHAAQIAARLGDSQGSPYVRASTPLLLAGVSDRTTAMLRTLMGPLGIEPLQTGGGLGVQLVSGDISMLALGTVTHVEGTRLAGFGHPMMSGGDSSLPTAIGRVLWINMGMQRSFKVGESARPLGTLVQDRQSGVVIDETRRAPTFPVTVDVVGVDGAPKKVWHVEVTHNRFMGPNLTAGALGSVVDATVAEQRDVTWQLRSRIALRGHGTLEIEDFGVAVGGMPDDGDFGGSRLVRALGDVLNNPWEEVTIDKVEATMTVKYDREVWHLRGIEVMRDVIDAGQHAHLRVHLVPHQGKEVVREIEASIPAELAGSDVEIEVIPGYEVAPEVAAPSNLPELLANETRQSLPGRSLVLQVKVPSQGVVFQGALAPRLPGFALDALRPSHSSTGGDAVFSYVRTTVPMDRYVEGHDKVKVKVRRVMR